ncbi:MAG: L,D-transpeptidase family protein [Minwuia sp.]|uniref:L,D-transpeptidase family protein n=1 Tax=Minwuia sp. TaxID=2493630 RepID=UPI003A8C4909
MSANILYQNITTRPAPGRRLTGTRAAVAAMAAAGVLLPMSVEAQHMGTPHQGPLAIGSDATKARAGRPASEPLRREIEAQVLGGEIEERLGGQTDKGVVTALRAAYAQYLFEPIWTAESAHDLYDTAADSFSRGIVIEDGGLQQIDDLIERRNSADPAVAAEADIGLSTIFLRLAGEVSNGLSDEGEAAEPRRFGPNQAKLTRAIVNAGNGSIEAALDSLEPEHPQFSKLKSALEQYRGIADRGGWLAIPAGGIVREGERDARIPALRERLAVEGFGDGRPMLMDQPDRFDAGTVTALKAFQRRHGLEDDGVLGPNTLEALNESVESKIDRIVDTMYRLRKQGDFGERHVWVNIPSFTAEGWNAGHREISMKTIVGRPDRQTPIFSDEVEYVVTSPKWNVPVSILRRDKMPKLREDASYARQNNFRVFERASGAEVSAYSVNWNDPSSAKRYKLVQEPGDNNALGQLKIIFPNQYSVYMHGTPSVHLFEEAKRTFSSGCVRLERPEDMAKWIASRDPVLRPEQVDEKLSRKDHKWMGVGERIPVHITYFTVTADGDGGVNFWRDVYDRQPYIASVKQQAPLYTPRDRTLTRADAAKKKG